MNIANVQEGGSRLRNQTLSLSLHSKWNFTICVVMQLWLNRSMSIKTFVHIAINSVRPNLIYNKTTKTLKLQCYSTNLPASETSITLLNSFNGKRVAFWLTKYGGRYGVAPGTANNPTVKASISNYSSTLTLLSS